MLQINTKEMKNFRDTVAKWHIANFDMADERITKSKTIKSLETLINTNNEVIAKSKNPAEIEKRQAEIVEFQKKITDEKERVAKHIEALEPNIAAGRDLISAEFLRKLENYLDNIYEDDIEEATLKAIANWFMENGAVGVVETDVRKYLRPIGKKMSSAKKACETNRHTTREKGNKLKDAFLGALCDDPTFISLLPVYSWTNKIEQKSKKQK